MKEADKDLEIIDFFDQRTLADIYKYSTDPFLSFKKNEPVTPKWQWKINDMDRNSGNIPEGSGAADHKLISGGNIVHDFSNVYNKFPFGNDANNLILTNVINTYASFFLSFWIKFPTMPTYELFKMVDLKNKNLTIDGKSVNYAELSHSNLGGANKCIFSSYSYCFFDDKLMDGLVYYWPMDEGSGHTIKDIASSKNATHFRNINGVKWDSIEDASRI